MEEILNTIQNYNSSNVLITNTTYARRVYTLINKGQNIENYEKTIEFLKLNYKQKTYKSFLTSIVVYLKAKGQHELAEKYGREMKIVNDIIQTKEKDNIPNENEKNNMITRSEIKDLIETLNKSIINEKDTLKKLDLIKQHLVVNLYYQILPLRNDYVGCLVVDTMPFFLDKTKNYIDLGKKLLILNRYKTSRYYGEKEIILPESLIEIIQNYIKFRSEVYPRIKDNQELLLTIYLKPMNQVNLTQFLNKIFKKKISSTILRKSFITEKYPVTFSNNEMERDAEAMGHSVSIQQSTYRKKV